MLISIQHWLNKFHYLNMKKIYAKIVPMMSFFLLDEFLKLLANLKKQCDFLGPHFSNYLKNFPLIGILVTCICSMAIFNEAWPGSEPAGSANQFIKKNCGMVKQLLTKQFLCIANGDLAILLCICGICCC
ncbi:MAG: hypothetical protein BWY54_00536 [Candidatus Dependentiae bacterium ADurb.Bin331]|nr:MAG: hypothetical protein BWY54_00536 [Candidatus Dependentiae bacterium ADurb.Bin331]